MPTPSTCPKCQGRMTEGFVVDNTYGSRAADRWYQGPPEVSMWTGVKTRGRPSFGVATYRCTRCGFLESYATAP